MEGEEIGLVLARVSELWAKVSRCIGRSRVDEGGGIATDDEGGEDESLLGIRNALGSLEHQLAALQALQHHQRCERETILTQIDRSRLNLLGKVKEYEGEAQEVIHEVAAFAGEAAELDDGLVLPPYLIHLPDLFLLDDIRDGPHLMAKNKPLSNQADVNGATFETDKNHGNRASKGIRHLMSFVKSAVALVSVISILSFAGYKPILERKPNAMMLFGRPSPNESQVTTPNQCPQGKVLVTEDGKARCVVKERVEVPFESDVTSPNIRYGFGRMDHYGGSIKRSIQNLAQKTFGTANQFAQEHLECVTIS